MAACIDSALIEEAERAAAILKKKKLSIVTAESCTAGLISAVFAQVEGASDMLQGSFVTYTKEAKSKALGVDADLLEEIGSVDAKVAEQMACGALERSAADIALAVTGVLGPAPDEDGNPIGLVYLAVCARGEAPKTVKKTYDDDMVADAMRRQVIKDALALIETAARL